MLFTTRQTQSRSTWLCLLQEQGASWARQRTSTLHGSWLIAPKQSLPSVSLQEASLLSVGVHFPLEFLLSRCLWTVLLTSQQGCRVRDNLFPPPEAKASISLMTDNLFPQGQRAKLSILNEWPARVSWLMLVLWSEEKGLIPRPTLRLLRDVDSRLGPWGYQLALNMFLGPMA